MITGSQGPAVHTPPVTGIQPHVLRWWLWVSLTGVAAAIAGMFGFLHMLAAQDATYLGFGVLALYAACTVWLGLKIMAGDTDYDFVWYVAETMERVGLLGTFIGLAVAFNGISGIDPNAPEFKTAILHGVLTKLYCSLVGLAGSMCLKTQIKILEMRGEIDAGTTERSASV